MNGFIKIDANGSLDMPFMQNLGFSVADTTTIIYAIEIQSDDKILVGGAIPTYRINNTPISGIRNLLRLNQDGSFDNSFILPNLNGPVLDITFDDTDSSILVAGKFTSLNNDSQFRRGLRLKTDGTISNGFFGFSAEAEEDFLEKQVYSNRVVIKNDEVYFSLHSDTTGQSVILMYPNATTTTTIISPFNPIFFYVIIFYNDLFFYGSSEGLIQLGSNTSTIITTEPTRETIILNDNTQLFASATTSNQYRVRKCNTTYSLTNVVEGFNAPINTMAEQIVIS